MSEDITLDGPESVSQKRLEPSVVNYSLRPAKNIERKMMAEAFARLYPLCPLSDFRYIGMGSEFFNDFVLFHETLGVEDMLSIECNRPERCSFNRPFGCIDIRPDSVSKVLPTLSWTKRTIMWLDYNSKLDDAILKDARLAISQACSGTLLIWTVNANPWGDEPEETSGARIKMSDAPARRLAKLRDLVGSTRVRSELTGVELAGWGLAKEFHAILTDEIRIALNDRNASSLVSNLVKFHQCFHFRYADRQRMLTVGGILLNNADCKSLGQNPFAGLRFIRDGVTALEIKPPILTSREVRHLNDLLPRADAEKKRPKWLSAPEFSEYRDLYRYYPVFAESEL